MHYNVYVNWNSGRTLVAIVSCEQDAVFVAEAFSKALGKSTDWAEGNEEVFKEGLGFPRFPHGFMKEAK